MFLSILLVFQLELNYSEFLRTKGCLNANHVFGMEIGMLWAWYVFPPLAVVTFLFHMVSDRATSSAHGQRPCDRIIISLMVSDRATV